MPLVCFVLCLFQVFGENVRVFNKLVKTVSIVTCFKHSLHLRRAENGRKPEEKREREDESPNKLLAVWENNYKANLRSEKWSGSFLLCSTFFVNL